MSNGKKLDDFNRHGGLTIVAMPGFEDLAMEVKWRVEEHGRREDKKRTLIDIAVRPAYAGGVHKVLDAYRAAQEKVSVNHLAATLRQLAYLYPYHQAIGFLMQRAGYEAGRLAPLRRPEMNVDFYLMHGMRAKEYDRTWRLFFPKGL